MLPQHSSAFLSSCGVHKSLLGWRLAVLPFRAAGATDSFRIALGMSEEISALISRYGLPRLIAPATFWDGTGPADDVLGRCRLYELDYTMDGTIEVDGDDVRVNVALLDVPLGFEVIWTETFIGKMTNLFGLQYQIAVETVRQLDPDLSSRGPSSRPSSETTVATAHHFVLAAIQGIYRLDRHRFTRARSMLTEAIVLDPDYAAAYAWLAYWSLMAVGLGWVDDARNVTVLAGVSAERAIQLDPMNARAFSIAGHVKAYLQHDVHKALELHSNAIRLDPNLPVAWALSSISKSYNGDHLTAIRQANTARSLSPRDPHIYWAEHNATWAHFFNRDLGQAETLSEVVLSRNPDHISAINVHLGILGHTGQRAEANYWTDKLRSISPGITATRIVERAPWQPNDRNYLAEGLSLAGIQD